MPMRFRGSARSASLGAVCLLGVTALAGCSATVKGDATSKMEERLDGVAERLEYLAGEAPHDQLASRIEEGGLYTELALNGQMPDLSASPGGPPEELVFGIAYDSDGALRVSVLEAAQSTGSVGLFGSDTIAVMSCSDVVLAPGGRPSGASAECPDYAAEVYSAYEEVGTHL